MKKKKTILSILTIIAVLFITACSGQSTDEDGTPDNYSESGKNEMITVKTSYGEIEYPVGYEEIVSAEKIDASDREEHVFYALLNGEKIKVYTITFSDSKLSDGGDLIGTTINNDGNTVNIYLLPEETIVNDEMSDDDKNLVYAAQETLNDVVASLSKWTDFKPAG